MPARLGARTLSSVAVVLVAGVLVYGSRPVLSLILLALALLAVSELHGLLGAKGPALPLPLGFALVAALVLGGASGRPALLDLAVFLTLAAPLVWAMLGGPRSDGLAAWAFASVGALSVGWPLAHLSLLRDLPDGRGWLTLVIACTWATDTGAYLFGSLFGARKLAPSISPGKTLEGALGGLATTALVGVLVGALVTLPIGVGVVAVVALALSLAAQAGDLAESYIKRVAGWKDSGTLLPGHGGLLDRIDGLLWAAVAAYYLAIWLR